jgi:hypothetical protein
MVLNESVASSKGVCWRLDPVYLLFHLQQQAATNHDDDGKKNTQGDPQVKMSTDFS